MAFTDLMLKAQNELRKKGVSKRPLPDYQFVHESSLEHSRHRREWEALVKAGLATKEPTANGHYYTKLVGEKAPKVAEEKAPKVVEEKAPKVVKLVKESKDTRDE